MRPSWLLLAGCGRIAFDATATDGIADVAAACAMSVGHDEDRDGVDDGCDHCPHVADPAQPDSDADGVGDACDPRPSVPGDSIVFFDAFVGAADPVWFYPIRSPQFVVDATGDSVHIDARTTDFIMLRDQVLADDLVVVGARLGAFSGVVQITTIVTVVGAGYYYCELFDGGNDAKLGLTYTPDGVQYIVDGSVPLVSPIANGAVTLAMRHGAEIGCATTWSPGETYAGPRPLAQTIEETGLYVQGVVADIDFMIQIRSE